MQRGRTTGVAVATIVVACLSARFSGVAEGVLHLAPALLLALPLWWGRYPGEERIAVLACAASTRRAVAAVAPTPCWRTRDLARTSVSRGGELIAVSLARRGPPRRLAATAR